MPLIHIVFGPLGAGKSTYAQRLSIDDGAICFSIDQWMVDLYGPESPDSLSLQWVMERVKRCERRIWLTARDIGKNAGNVVLDLGFMTKASRMEFLQLAQVEGMDSKMHYVNAPYAVRRARVMNRNKVKGETFAFELSPALFDFMDSQFETATQDELSASVVVDTEVQD